MALEHSTVPVGSGFDPARPDHVAKVLAAVTTAHGPGWELSHYDPATRTAHVQRRSAITTTTTAPVDGRSKLVTLGPGFGPNDAEKAAALLAAMPDHAGMVMTRYDPWRDEVELTRLTPDEARAREAVAVALAVKPWDVQVHHDPTGGFIFQVPASYTPSKHDAKLLEVATTVVGRPGWYLDADVPGLRVRMVPANPPTFPAVIPYPAQIANNLAQQGKLLVGQTLPATGDQPGGWLAVNLDDTPHIAVNGTTGSGKSVCINALIRSAMIAGMELAVIDLPHKAVDFTWVKPYVRPHGWGCESLEDAVVVFKLLYQEGERRARLLKQYDVEKLTKLPDKVRAELPRILIVVDELSGLLQLTDKLLGLPKEHPDRIAATQENALHSLVLGELLKIAAQMRFVGLHLVLSTQVANTTTGIPPKLRTLLGGKLLLGVNQNDNNRNQTFNDPASVPTIPEQLKIDAAAGRGSGTAELEGQPPVVFKSAYADTADHKTAIARLRRVTGEMAEPSDEQRREFLSFLYEDEDGQPRPTLPDTPLDSNGRRLRGAAAAAKALKDAAA